jgi:hypothetical protein
MVDGKQEVVGEVGALKMRITCGEKFENCKTEQKLRRRKILVDDVKDETFRS